MKKYVYKLSDMALRALNPTGDNAANYEDVEGLISFTLPDVEAGTEEISNQSGLTGTLELVDWMNVGALELGLTFAGMPENSAIFMKPGKNDLKLYWVEKYAQKDGTEGYNSYFVNAVGQLKKFPGGDGEKGSVKENEVTYSLFYYKYCRNGKVLFEYEPAQNNVTFHGTNYASSMTDELYKGEAAS